MNYFCLVAEGMEKCSPNAVYQIENTRYACSDVHFWYETSWLSFIIIIISFFAMYISTTKQ